MAPGTRPGRRGGGGGEQEKWEEGREETETDRSSKRYLDDRGGREGKGGGRERAS